MSTTFETLLDEAGALIAVAHYSKKKKQRCSVSLLRRAAILRALLDTKQKGLFFSSVTLSSYVCTEACSLCWTGHCLATYFLDLCAGASRCHFGGLQHRNHNRKPLQMDTIRNIPAAGDPFLHILQKKSIVFLGIVPKQAAQIHMPCFCFVSVLVIHSAPAWLERICSFSDPSLLLCSNGRKEFCGRKNLHLRGASGTEQRQQNS